MLVDDANRLATEITERASMGAAADQGVAAKVHVDKIQPGSVPRGAGRPTFTRYFVQVEDATRVAMLDLDTAGTLIDEFEQSWDADGIFDAIRARDVAVEAKQ
ncbi:MAG: hypothetical protein H0W01_01895 [Pseudonocardiales bacterium]|nr:hypothetical protein [Pseudonocardiales bacterium]